MLKKMRYALEQSVNNINRRKQGEEDEESAIQDRRRDQDKDEEEKSPRLLVAPAVEDPPRDNQIQEKIDDPEGVHPINAPMRARLQHFADASEHARHAQRENDRDENGEVTERIHR